MEQGKLDVVVTYLEMTEKPSRRPTPRPSGNLALMRLEKPEVGFYRYLYNSVGERWFWVDRRILSDEELAAAIQAEGIDIFVLYCGGAPAGYSEIDRSNLPEVAIRYFGLLPQFIGRGLGRMLLDWSIEYCWSLSGTTRLIVDTCSLDHPKAFATYQKAGFRPYRQIRKRIIDPRIQGLIPASIEPLLPSDLVMQNLAQE